MNKKVRTNETESGAAAVAKASQLTTRKTRRTKALEERFAAMTAEDHAEMKRRLLARAQGGQPKPSAKTLEGYALLAYTTPAEATASTPTAVGADSQRTTKKFEVIVAQHVPAYMTLEVEASDEQEAITKANRRIEFGEFDVDIDGLCYNDGWKIGYPDDREVKVVWSREIK